MMKINIEEMVHWKMRKFIEFNPLVVKCNQSIHAFLTRICRRLVGVRAHNINASEINVAASWRTDENKFARVPGGSMLWAARLPITHHKLIIKTSKVSIHHLNTGYWYHIYMLMLCGSSGGLICMFICGYILSQGNDRRVYADSGESHL